MMMLYSTVYIANADRTSFERVQTLPDIQSTMTDVEDIALGRGDARAAGGLSAALALAV